MMKQTLTNSQLKLLFKSDNGKLIQIIYDGLNAKEAAEEYGLCFRTVYDRLNKEGKAIGVNLTPMLLKKSRLYHMKKSGKSFKEIKEFAGYKTYSGVEFLM